MLRPGSFPDNLLVGLFGQPELTGTYELMTPEGTTKGTFIAGRMERSGGSSSRQPATMW
jgi:hypothetical protein